LSVTARKICPCKDCDAKGGLDSNGRPKGVQFASADYGAQIAAGAGLRNQQKVKEQAESDEQQRQRALQLQMQEEIVGLILNDTGPDLDNQPSKLWASREEFQERVVTPSRVRDPPLDDLAQSFSQISLFADSPPPSEPKQSKKYDKREKNHRTDETWLIYNDLFCTNNPNPEADICHEALLVTKISQYHAKSIKFVLDDLKLSCASDKTNLCVTQVQMGEALVDWVSVQHLKLYISQILTIVFNSANPNRYNLINHHMSHSQPHPSLNAFARLSNILSHHRG
jgi:hypothetical protein